MAIKNVLTIGLLIGLGMSSKVQALPFNDDMVESQISAGQVMRPKVADTVPLGSADYLTYSKEEAALLKNIKTANPVSVLTGKRLFAINCSPCHGKISKKNYVPGAVSQFMPGPNLADDFYKQRTDGDILATVKYGNIIMPAIGWKLSNNEIWDIVNYIRETQSE